MRLLVCGGREYSRLGKDKTYAQYSEEYNIVIGSILDTLYAYAPEIPLKGNIIISGMARGVDTTAAEYADDMDITLWKFPADWGKCGRSAGILRNIQMLNEGQPDVVLAIKGGKGTAHMVRIAEAAGVPVIKVT